MNTWLENLWQRLRSDEGFGDGLKLFVLEGDGVLLKVNEDVKWLQLLVKKDDWRKKVEDEDDEGC